MNEWTKYLLKKYFKKFFPLFLAFIVGILVCGSFHSCSEANANFDRFDPKVGTTLVDRESVHPKDLKWFHLVDESNPHYRTTGDIYGYGTRADYLFGFIQSCPKHKVWHVVIMTTQRHITLDKPFQIVHYGDAQTFEDAKKALEEYAQLIYDATKKPDY